MSEITQAYFLPFSIVIMLVLLYFVIRYKKTVNTQKQTLEEKEKKITWLRQIGAENDQRHIAKAHEFEKNIQTLNHNIENLELKAKEGTKNQVVAKIEAQQSKRARQLERAGLEVE